VTQPKITGYVFNKETNEPIDNCNVNGVYTNSKGYYKIKKISHLEFIPILSCEIGNRRLPKEKDLRLRKAGFYDDTIDIRQSSIVQKETRIKMDTIFLTGIK